MNFENVISLILMVFTAIFLKLIFCRNYTKKRPKREPIIIDQQILYADGQVLYNDFGFNYPKCDRVSNSSLFHLEQQTNEEYTEAEKIMLKNNRKNAKLNSKLLRNRSMSNEIYKRNARFILKKNSLSSIDSDGDFNGMIVEEALSILPELLTKAEVCGRRTFTLKIGGVINEKETKLINAIRKWLEDESFGFETPIVGKFIIHL